MKRFIMAMSLLLATSGIAITLQSASTIVLRGQVDTMLVNKIMFKIMSLKAEDITIYISSPGGSVVAGNKLIEFMSTSNKKFTCVAEFAASMAFAIFQQCDVRVITPTSILMQHQASYGVEGSMNKNRALIRMLEDLVEHAERISAKRLRLTIQEYRELIRDDLWIYGKSAFKYRAADKLSSVKCSKKMVKETRKEVQRSMFGKSVIIWSACPILQLPRSYRGEPILDSRSDWDRDFIVNVNTLGGG